MKAETKRGKTALLKRYDAAYITELERGRGPISAHEYARVAAAADPEDAARALEELKLPDGALMRLHRVWLGKMTKDPALGESVRKAMERAREE
jgi:hypothetical protein